MSEIKIDPEQLKKLADVYQQGEDEAENTLKELKWDTSELMLTLTLSSTGRIRDLQSELNHSIETYRQKVDETQEAVMIARAAIQSADRSMAAHFGIFGLELLGYYDIQRIYPENEFDPTTGKKLSDFDRNLALVMLLLTIVPPAKAVGIAAKMGMKGLKTYLVREGAYLIRSAKNVMNPKVLKQMGKMALAAIIAGPMAKTAQGLKALIKDMKEIGNTLKYLGGNLEDKLEFEKIGPDIIVETANSKSAKEILEMIKDKALSNIEKAKETLVRFGGKGKSAGSSSKDINDVVKDGSHFLDEFKLKPNMKYETNGYLYQTDELGRIERASGELTLEMGERNSKHQLAAGESDRVKGPSTQGDHGGHLIGTQFNGSPLIDNIVAMNGNVNVSAYKKLESAWAKALRDNREVVVDIRPVYEGNSVRPVSFNIKYKIDGEKFKANLKNVYGGT